MRELQPSGKDGKDFCDLCQCKDPAAQENSEKYSADSQEKRSQRNSDRKQGDDGSSNCSQKCQIFIKKNLVSCMRDTCIAGTMERPISSPETPPATMIPAQKPIKHRISC